MVLVWQSTIKMTSCPKDKEKKELTFLKKYDIIFIEKRKREKTKWLVNQRTMMKDLSGALAQPSLARKLPKKGLVNLA